MTEVISTDTNPELAAQAVQSLIAPDAPQAPTIPTPEPGFFSLPGGLVRSLGASTQKDAEVRELNGEDEEYVDRVKRGNPSKAYEALIERGLVGVGGDPVSKTELREMLLADAEKCLIEIRRSTYGENLEYEGLTCPHCKEVFDLNLSLDDIPVTPLERSEDRFFTVKLRRGGVAHVRLPRLADIVEGEDLTPSEYNTLLLANLVLSIEKDGERKPVAGSPDAARALSLADREAILGELNKRKVGPQWAATKFVHSTCGEEVPFPLTVGDLFPSL